ncbi:hypothetical protein KZ774_14010 [Escherichia coli]|nr:hypothetical protein [Escherichia coli]
MTRLTLLTLASINQSNGKNNESVKKHFCANYGEKKENLMESDERILQHDDFAEIMKNYTG